MDMDDFLAEITPPVDNDFLAKVTSKSWRAELADILDAEILSATKAMEWLTLRGEPTPASISSMVLDEQAKRKRVRPRGRPKQTGSTPRQGADDIACYLAVERLKALGSKSTPAGESVGKLMNLSRQAVLGAWTRVSVRMEKSKNNS